MTYTDGSKSSEGVGCAFVSGDSTRSFTLPEHASVFTSELIALVKALCFIEVGHETSHVILTDSLSSLLALRSYYPQNPILQDILKRLTALDQAGKKITLCWVPSHVGIPGNERADAAAKRASQAVCTRRLPLPARDFYPAISSRMFSKWQRAWDETCRNKLREIKPRLTRWQTLCKSRKEEVTLCRLRVGHTYATHIYLLSGEDPPSCPRCGDVLSVRHILVSCRYLRTERVRFFGSDLVSMSALVGENSCLISEVFAFLNHIEFPVIFSPAS